LTELGFDGGEGVRVDRPARAGHLRRPLLVFAVAVLCGAAYLAGIWTGTTTNITCNVTGPDRIVCGSDPSRLPAPVPPATPAPPQATPSA
jgi:hypothetical protein